MAGQYRNWCITLNNPQAMETVFWADLLQNGHNAVQYVVMQSEMEGTLHYQAYVEFKRAKRIGGVKAIFGQRVHLERRRGTQEQAIAYCKKTDTRVNGLSGEWGTPKRVSGAKRDLATIANGLRSGELDMMDIEEDFGGIYLLHKDKIEDYAIKLLGSRRWAMEVEIYVGESGAGKSYTADLENPGAYYVPWPTGGRWWWPGYKGQSCVVMDEFRHQIKMDVMLKMLDRYTWVLEAKGRSFEFVSKKIVITTNIDPKDWYPKVSEAVKEPLARRIREFCKIYDFAPDRVFAPQNQLGAFEKTRRTERFEFNPTVSFNRGEY